MTVRFTLFHRRGCHLCDDMLDELEALCHGQTAEIELVDIDGDPVLAATYATEIPVLFADGDELCRYRLDAAAVRALF